MPPQPKTKPLNPNHSLASMFDTRFLKPWHLLDRNATEFTDVIRHVTREQLGNPQDDKWGSVLYFTNNKVPAPYLLGTKEDLETLLEVYQVHTIGELVGLRITIWVTSWNNKDVLRIKPKRPTTRLSSPKSEPGAAPQPINQATDDIDIDELTEEDDHDHPE